MIFHDFHEMCKYSGLREAIRPQAEERTVCYGGGGRANWVRGYPGGEGARDSRRANAATMVGGYQARLKVNLQPNHQLFLCQADLQEL